MGEVFNPAETFGDIMIDYDYVECSSACVTALAASRAAPWRAPCRDRPRHRPPWDFLLSIQRPDGSWYGSWGVCFTYAGWFGIKGCSPRAKHESCAAIRKATDFLPRSCRGGWGESYLSCQDKVYSNLDYAHIVNTAWVMLALIACGQMKRDAAPMHRAAKVLMGLQLPSGDWRSSPSWACSTAISASRSALCR